MLEGFTARTFSGRVGEKFTIHCDDGDSLAVELVSVESDGGEPDGRPFSIVFRSPGDEPLSQGIRWMEHDGIGNFELFLVPIGRSPDGERLLYEAVFN